jgi:hypothetical protein
VNKTARYVRRAMGWGDDADLGLQMRKAAATGLVRSVRAILPHRQSGSVATETRDGQGNATRIEINTPTEAPKTPETAATPAPVRRRAVSPLAPSTPAEHTATLNRMSRLRAAQQRAALAAAEPVTTEPT